MREEIHLTVHEESPIRLTAQENEHIRTSTEELRIIEAVSPTVDLEREENSVLITVHDLNGTKSEYIYDGEKGEKGDKGDKGDPGRDADPTVLIDDTSVQSDKTWSSSKIDNDKANKTDTVLNTTLSRGRSDGYPVGEGSFAFGYHIIASGAYAHAEGGSTSATAINSHAEGYGTTASAAQSHAEGVGTTASAPNAHAEGVATTASGSNSHAEGASNTASGSNSHAEGGNTTASAPQSHAEGLNTIANHKDQHVFGEYNIADTSVAEPTERGTYIEIVGNGDDNARSNARTLDWSGNEVIAGDLTINKGTANEKTVGTEFASLSADIAAKYTKPANGIPASDLENGVIPDVSGKADKADTVLDTTLSRGRKADTAIGTASFAFGNNITASGSYSHAEGSGTKATGSGAHAEGGSSEASGGCAHAEGLSTKATDSNAHAEGQQTEASATSSHAEGRSTKATASGAHAEGTNTTASGSYSHAEGGYSTSSGWYSHAEGYSSIANHAFQHVFGQFNIEDPSEASTSVRGNYVEIVGNGTASAHSNARTLDWDGNEVLSGDLTINNGTANQKAVGTELTSLNTSIQSKYTKPQSGIPASDLAEGVIPDISGKVDKADIGVANGIASLDGTGKVPQSQLPSYVDDVVEYASLSNFPAEGETGKIYVALDTNKTYRWSGTTYIEVGGNDGVIDVQVNGTSVVSSGVANIPLAGENTFGAVMLGVAKGTGLASSNELYVVGASDSTIKSGAHQFQPIMPYRQHVSTFYGLAKAAGDSTQSTSSNSVGTYTDEAKSAIRTMLGAVGDVQVDGASIVSNGVAVLPNAETNAVGVTKLASDADIKAGNSKRVVTAIKQDKSVFYGLAAAAGDTTQSASANAVGTYTDSAKSAIQTMLGTNDVVAVSDTQPTTANTKIWVDNDATGQSFQVPTVAEMNTALASKVSDVQVNGVSVMSNGIANIPYAQNGEFGVVKVAGNGITLYQGQLMTQKATPEEIKAGINTNKPIVPYSQHESVFYGLAKLAGQDMASSSNQVGTFTEEAKAAIKSMLGINEVEVVRLI